MKKWEIYPENVQTVYQLCQDLNISSSLARILSNRGVSSSAEAEKFLNPRLNHLNDPFEIPNIRPAAERVLRARESGEKVLVYGDYDVDGVTGTAILMHTLKFLEINASYYIPHRYGEGYSLSLESVKKIAASGVKLMVTVDCGIANVIEIEEANALGMEVVVTDHHNLPHTLPRAFAIVNPKQLRPGHPSRNLSGAGVAFKFAWALLRQAGRKDNAFLTSLLDLASLGTISDVVPLTGENRILAAGGLKLINERKRYGLKYLADSASLFGKIAVNQIYFGLAPRLNAAGRLDHASKAVELLLTDDPDSARELASELSRINSQRKDLGSGIKEDVFSKIEQALEKENKIVFLAGEDWHPGVIGIVASQVVDTYHRPTVLISIKDSVGRGSARSVEGLNVFELLDSCRDLFLDFGGHEGAAGFEIAADNIRELERRLKEIAEEKIDPAVLVPKIAIDAEIDPLHISLGLIAELEKLQPFGEGNPDPVFMIRGLRLLDHKTVGSTQKHLKAWFSRDGVNLETIGFGWGHFSGQLDYQKNYDIAFKLESNEYNGFASAQLNLVDIKEGA